MANIFEINEAIRGCVDAETGEIIDIELLEQLQMARDEKIENAAMLRKEYAALEEALGDEIERLRVRKEQALKNKERLETYITTALDGDKFESAKCKITFRASESLVISESAEIPDEYIVIKETRSPDKKALKDALKHGTEIPGCVIERKLNPQIK